MNRARLGDILIDVVTSESVNNSTGVTSRPTENGDISDGVNREPYTLSISGYCVGENAWQRLQTLRRYQEEGVLLKYTHRNSQSNIVIESLSTDHGNNVTGGFGFSCTLKEIKIARAQIFSGSRNLTAELASQLREVAELGLQAIRSR